MSQLDPYLRSEVSSRIRTGMSDVWTLLEKVPEPLEFSFDQLEEFAMGIYVMGFGHGASEGMKSELAQGMLRVSEQNTGTKPRED